MTDKSDPPPRLTILCLHGFRQNASQFKGRLRALQRKLSGVTTLVFLDAPYVLPLWYKADTYAAGDPLLPPPCEQQATAAGSAASAEESAAAAGCRSTSAAPGSFPAGLPRPKRAWLLSQDLLAAQPQLQALFSSSSSSSSNDPDAAAASQQQLAMQASGWLAEQQHDLLAQPPQHSSAGLRQGSSHGTEAEQQQQRQQQQQQASALWLPAPAHIVTQEQYTSQACGWQGSWQVIQAALAAGIQQEPCQQQQQESQQPREAHHTQQQQQQQQRLPRIDGLLGFSQGAAVAAVVAALCQQQQQQQPCNSSSRSDLSDSATPPPSLKFVILASGFVSPAEEHQQLLLHQQCPIQVPSLHLFAAAADGGADRQIQERMSEQLLGLFEQSSRRVIRHAGGHMLPIDADTVAAMKGFLKQF